MSLTMMAMRIAAVEAIKGAGTLVGSNVLDSQISALDRTADGALQSDQPGPFVAVYTDAAKTQEPGPTGLRANGRVDIAFNCGVSMTMAETDRETGESKLVGLYPATDAGLEAIIDALDVQIARALTDPDDPWAQVFGDFVMSYVAKEVLRANSSSDRDRIAAGQTKLTVEVIADPAHGQALAEGGPWPRFMALMAAQDMPQTSLFQQLIGPDGADGGNAVERLTSMSVRTAAALFLQRPAGVARGERIQAASISGDRA
jgi:hypothetical protein